MQYYDNTYDVDVLAYLHFFEHITHMLFWYAREYEHWPFEVILILVYIISLHADLRCGRGQIKQKFVTTKFNKSREV